MKRGNNDLLIAGAIIGLVVISLLSCYYLFVTSQERDQYKADAEALTVQNVQLAKDVRIATVRAFRDGLIVCGNEDIAYFQGVADQYPNTAVADVFNRMADNWAYDDDKMDQLTEDYMDREY